MTDFEDEIREAARQVHERMVNDPYFGDQPPYSGGAGGALRPSLAFRPPGLAWDDVITNPFIVKKVTRCREKYRGFWRRLWDAFWDFNPWPYTPVEFYEVEEAWDCE